MKYKVTIGKSTFEVEIEDITARPIVAIVDGERFEVWPEASRPAPPPILQPLPLRPRKRRPTLSLCPQR